MPGDEHAFADVIETLMGVYSFTNLWRSSRNGVADRLDDFRLFFHLDAKIGDDKFLQCLARRPGLFSHEADARLDSHLERLKHEDSKAGGPRRKK